MRLIVHHQIDYSFSEPQARLVQLLRLTPPSLAGQTVTEWRVDVDCDARLKPGRDGFCNETTMLYIDRPFTHVRVVAHGEAMTDDRAGMIAGTMETLPPLFYLQQTSLTTPDAAAIAFAKDTVADHADPLARAHALNDSLHETLVVDTSGYAPLTDAATAFARGAGSAQDAAQLLVGSARAIGLPARYVSGLMLRPDDHDSAAHGWAELHVDGYGWIGFDPARGRCPDDHYLRVAVGLDRQDAAPVSGTRVGGGSEHLAITARLTADPVRA